MKTNLDWSLAHLEKGAYNIPNPTDINWQPLTPAFQAQEHQSIGSSAKKTIKPTGLKNVHRKSVRWHEVMSQDFCWWICKATVRSLITPDQYVIGQDSKIDKKGIWTGVPLANKSTEIQQGEYGFNCILKHVRNCANVNCIARWCGYTPLGDTLWIIHIWAMHYLWMALYM